MTLTENTETTFNSTETGNSAETGNGFSAVGLISAPTETPGVFSEANVAEVYSEMTWEDLASCRSVDNASDLFFSEELHEIAAAKRVCAECPVIAPCLEGALRRAEPCGVWGGQLFESGKILTIKRRRGRPPKNPRPEDQIPMVPIPEHLEKLIA